MAAPSPREPVVFSQTLEALLTHAMHGRLDAQALRRIEALGIDLTRPLQVAYPLTVWYELVLLCSGLLFPKLPRAEALYAIGRKVAEGYTQTAMGKALFESLRVMGWQRALGKLARSLRTGGNALEAHATALPNGDSEVTLEILPEFHAALGSHPGIDSHFMRGFLDASAELVRGPKCPTFTLTTVDPLTRRATFLLKEPA